MSGTLSGSKRRGGKLERPCELTENGNEHALTVKGWNETPEKSSNREVFRFAECLFG
jgi:hypothetical protein